MTNPALSADHPPAKRTVKKRIMRLGKRLVRSALLLYVLLLMGMYFLQSYLIFPAAKRQGSPDALVLPRAGEELVNLRTANDTQLTGLFGTSDRPIKPGSERPALPAVLYFYGNGQEMNSALFEFDLFRRLGVHCMLIDYPGYGMSGGKPSEQGCYDAAEAAYRYALSRPDVDKTHLIAAGWSLGGAVAIELVHRHQEEGTFCGLLTLSSFTSMVDVGKRHYPYLPVSTFLKHRFLSEEKVRRITIPYFLAHGKADPLIPFDMSDRLAAAYGGGTASLMRYNYPTAGHNDFFDVGGADLERAIGEFLQKITRK